MCNAIEKIDYCRAVIQADLAQFKDDLLPLESGELHVAERLGDSENAPLNANVWPRQRTILAAKRLGKEWPTDGIDAQKWPPTKAWRRYVT